MSPIAPIIGLFMITLFVFCFALTVVTEYYKWKIKRDMEFLRDREKQQCQRQYCRVRQRRDRAREKKEFRAKTKTAV